MAYSDFDLKRAVTELGLSRGTDTNLFAGVTPIEPSDYLRDCLAEFTPPAIAFGTESSRRETIIFPVLAEAERHSPPPVNIASGVTSDVDKARGRTGLCDYLLTRSPETYCVAAPAFAAVVAKKEDLTPGLGQCAAELVAVRIFNETEGHPRPVVYGCVANGHAWRFLKLDGSILTIDTVIDPLDRLLGILVRIASE